MNVNEQSDHEQYHGFPYKTYEEILEEKHRRARRRRRTFFTFLLLAAAMAALFVWSPFQNRLLHINDTLNNIRKEQSQNTALTQQDQTPKDYSMNISEPKDNTDSKVVVSDVSGIVEKVAHSVVGIITETYSDFSQSYSGSGIIISKDGYIITNNHVVEGGGSFTVVLYDNSNYPAYLIGADSQSDIAVLKVEGNNFQPAEFGDSDALKVGGAAIVIGCPGGVSLQGSTTMGIISGINRNLSVNGNTMSLIQTDAAINPGNSGGPLINQYGQVVGVTSVKISAEDYEGIGFAIPIDTVKPIVEQLISNGYVTGRPLVGLSVRTVSQMAASFYNMPQGLLVDSVESSSRAQSAGLTAGDIIVTINSERIYGLNDALSIRNQCKVGDKVTLGIYRNRKIYDVEVQLIEKASISNDYNF